MGRPETFNLKLAKEICETLGATSKGLTDLCKMYPHWPSYMTINRWRDRADFCEMYRCAKMKQADFMVDEIIKIADDGHNDTYVDDNGNVKTCVDVVQRSKLRVDTRKWIACKILPKVYGDKAEVNTNINSRNVTVSVNVSDPIEASRIYQQIMQSD